MARFKIKLPRVTWLRLLYCAFLLFYLVNSIFLLVIGEYMRALSNVVFFVAGVVWGRIVLMEARTINRLQKEREKDWQAMTALMRDNTIEDLERKRRSTWS